MASSNGNPQAAKDAGLVFVSDSAPGIMRKRSGQGFAYFYPDGRKVGGADLQRIKRLAVPPAYRDVWICLLPNGHLQATGRDARGRKQYRYHAAFREFEERDKFSRMLDFGLAQPALRSRVGEDLSRPGLSKDKVLAVVVYLLERSLIRVGNEEYVRENRSFGLTTFRNRHVKVSGSKIGFTFVGKRGVRHQIEVHDRRLARLVKKIQDLPGQELFQYVDEDGGVSSISSADVNGYLHRVTGREFTAKDFRTWWGTLLAWIELSGQDVPASDVAAKRGVSAAMKSVSHRLGNTPAVCRRSYVHPAVFDAYREGHLGGSLRDANSEEELLERAECAVLDLLAGWNPQKPEPRGRGPNRR